MKASSTDSVSNWRRKLPPGGTEGEADAHFHGAPCPAGQQQIGDVGAGNDQNDGGDAEQHEERSASFLMYRTLTHRARRHSKLPGLELRHRGIAHLFLKRCFDVGDDGMVDPIEGGLGLVQRDSGLESPEEVGPIGAAIVEAGWS